MTDWMGDLTAAAERQGFQVIQTQTGSWRFIRLGITVTSGPEPLSAMQFIALVRSLEGLGLTFPDAGE